MDASIILQGQPVNVLGALNSGTQLAANTYDLNRQGQYNALLRQHGAGIAAGNQDSLNALAAFDPQAALGVQQTRLGMDATRQNMDFAAETHGWNREEVRRATEAWAAQQDAATVEAERARLEAGLKGASFFYQRGDRAGYDKFLTENGVDPATVPFDQFPAQAAMYGDVLDTMTKFAPQQADWRVATPEEAASYGAAGGQINAKTGEFKAINPPSNMSIRTNPDGTMEMVQGPAGGQPKPMTEGQSKDVGFASRARGALEALDASGDTLTSLSNTAAGAVPLVGNYLQGSDYQVAKSASEEYMAAILRKDTGAAITKEEWARYGSIYIPQPGDTPQRLEYKRLARQRALAGLEAGMTPAQMLAVESVYPSAPAQPAQEPAAQPPADPGASGADGWVDIDGVKVRVKP